MLSQKHYTEAERQVLRDNPDMDLNVLAEKLNRSRKSVVSMRTNLGITRQARWNWTDEEIALIRDNPEMSLHELSKLTGRAVSSCHRYREILNAAGETPLSEPALAVQVHAPDAAFRSVLRRIALTFADGDEAVAAVLLTEMTNPSPERPTVGKLCGRDADTS